MFRLTTNVSIAQFRSVRVTALSWKRSVLNYTDTATITLPARCVLKRGVYESKVETSTLFDEGMAVQIDCGYDYQNKTRFKGFIKRINNTIPLELECEGYSYFLRKKVGVTKTYINTTVRKIVQDLIADTDIKLSDQIPQVSVSKAVFKMATGIQILEFLREKYLLSIYFNFDELYVGLLEMNARRVVDFQLGWNTIKDNSLKFNVKQEFADVRIKLSSRQSDGSTKTAYSGPTAGKIVEKKINTISEESVLESLAEAERRKIINRGYEGVLTTFLEPISNPSDTIRLLDSQYPARSGNYFVEEVEGSFSASGGRQKIKLGNSLGV